MIAALLEVGELVVAGAARAEQDDVAFAGDRFRLSDGGRKIAALVDGGTLTRGGIRDQRRDLRPRRADAKHGFRSLTQSGRQRGEGQSLVVSADDLQHSAPRKRIQRRDRGLGDRRDRIIEPPHAAGFVNELQAVGQPLEIPDRFLRRMRSRRPSPAPPPKRPGS